MQKVSYPGLGGVQILFLVFILALTGFVFRGVQKLEFTNWDDPTYVVENALIRSTEPEAINRMFTTFVSGNYHPLTMLSLAWDYSRGALNPEAYHQTNLVLHVANTALVFLVFFRIFQGNVFIACIIALFFGLHPLKVESVAWISERKDVLYAFFWLSAWFSYIHYRQSGKVIYLILTHLLFLFSCLSKGMAVTLIPVLILTDFLQNRNWTWRWLKEKFFLFLIAIGFGILAVIAQGKASAIGAPVDHNSLDHFLVGCHGIIFYLYKSVLPFHLSAFYPYPPKKEGWLPFIYLIAPVLVLLLSIAIGLIWQKTGNRPLLFGYLFFLCTLFPVLQWLPVGNAFAADRYYYLPSIGFILPIAWYANLISQKNGFYKWGIYAVFTLIFAGFSLKTLEQIKVWKDSITLFSHVAKLYPEIPEPYNNLGIEYGNKGNQRLAIQNYLRVLEINPAYGLTYNNLGNAYGLLGQYDSAYYYLQKAIELKPSANVWSNMGNALGMMGRIAESRQAYEKAIEMNPDFHEPYHNLGASYAMQGEYEKAIPYFEKAILALPDYKDAWFSLAMTYEYLKNAPEARRCYQKAGELGHPGAAEGLKRLNP